MKMELKKIKFVSIAIVAVGLSACTSAPINYQISLPRITSNNGYSLAQSHWSDVAKIRAEARRLSVQVSEGKLTKVQAAQYLDKYRISVSGRNSIDDSVFDVYLRSVVDSQRGAITPEQSKKNIEDALAGWQQRWTMMNNRPNNPAFTNFLLEWLKMKPLM